MLHNLSRRGSPDCCSKMMQNIKGNSLQFEAAHGNRKKTNSSLVA